MTPIPWLFLPVPLPIWVRIIWRRIHPFRVSRILISTFVAQPEGLLHLGQNLYTRGDEASLKNMDKQIYRLIGKATTLAASVSRSLQAVHFLRKSSTYRMAYRIRQGREFVTPPTGLSYTGSLVFLV